MIFVETVRNIYDLYLMQHIVGKAVNRLVLFISYIYSYLTNLGLTRNRLYHRPLMLFLYLRMSLTNRYQISSLSIPKNKGADQQQ